MKTTQILAMILVSMVWAATASALDVQLKWDPNSEVNLAGYKVYYGVDGFAAPEVQDVSNQTVATISGLDPAKNYSFAVTAYNTSSIESSFSNIVTVLESIPPSVSISNPGDNAKISGTVLVGASASDNIGVVKVEFLVNGNIQSTATTGPYQFYWDTTSLLPGTYSITAKAYDAAGNVGSTSISAIVASELTPPTVSCSVPVTGNASGTVMVSCSATDDVAVARVEIYVNSVMAAAFNSTPYQYAWDTTAVTNGQYTIAARAYDAAGNIGVSADSIVNVFNDTSAPTVSIVLPANSGTISGTVSISASATDNVGISRVEFYLDGILKATSSGEVYGYQLDTLTIANGAHSISARAYDAAGNIGVSADSIVNVFNDTSAPTVSIVLPANSGTISGTVSISASATDNVGISRVEFYLDGILKATSSGEVYGYQLDTLTIANGAHSISARAYDAAGNIGVSADSIVNVFNDTSAPTVSIILPANSGTISGTVSISASATDNVGVSRVEFYLDGILKATSSGGLYGYQLDTLTIANGTHSISARAYDAAGNEGVSADSIVNVFNDTSAPTVSIVLPANSGTISGTVSISASATDNVGVSRVEFYLDGILKATSSGGLYGYQLDTLTIADGAHSISARAYDAAGNIGLSGEVQISVANLPPPVSFTIADAMQALQIAVGRITPTDKEKALFDVAPYINGSSAPDGKINVNDVIVILAKITGRII